MALFRDFGNRLGQAEALNRLGELWSQTSATHKARESHAKALAIAQQIRVPLEEVRALEGIGRAGLEKGSFTEGQDCLRQALTIYQRLAAPDAARVQKILHDRG